MKKHKEHNNNTICSVSQTLWRTKEQEFLPILTFFTFFFLPPLRVYLKKNAKRRIEKKNCSFVPRHIARGLKNTEQKGEQTGNRNQKKLFLKEKEEVLIT